MPDDRSAEAGLTTAEAQRRAREFGPNTIPEEESPVWRRFAAKFWSPVPWLLEVAIVLQLVSGKDIEAAVVAALLLFNAGLGFVQESRARAALAALKRRLAPNALVRRDGQWVRLPAADLVPGDTIRLPLGGLVPADAVVRSGAILVDQSALTGESVPVETAPGLTVYAGAIVRRGEALASVTATGPRSRFAKTVELVRVAHAPSTEQQTILQITRSLALINGSVAVLIVIGAIATGLRLPDVVALALTALLASIPVALPATFTLSAAFGAQILARRGVLLTRLAAMHEAAAIDVLCADKTGTLTRNSIEVDEVVAMAGSDRARVLALAAFASSPAGLDPIDAAIRHAAAPANDRLDRFIPFDPETRTAEAFVTDDSGATLHVVKGAFDTVSKMSRCPDGAEATHDALAARGHRVLAVAAGPVGAPGLIGLIALSDPPREDSATLIQELRGLGVRTVMITGDSAATAAAIAGRVGIAEPVCPADCVAQPDSADRFGVFARVLPEQKYALVTALQANGHVVGMCGDGVNDAPALRQAQIGIAVASATDVAKAAAAMVLTEPGLGGIVFAVREGRVAFQRLLAYTLNMAAKKVEIVLFLAVGLALTGHAVMTPVLMVLMLLTNDFLSTSLTTDRASAAARPSRWRMRGITATAAVLGACTLAFSSAVLAVGAFRLHLSTAALQTLAFVTLVFGNQALLYVLRERRRFWASRPGRWVMLSSAVDIGLASALAVGGILMAPLSPTVIGAVAIAAAIWVLVLDQAKLVLMKRLRLE